MEKKIRTGLFGGSFNPIHRGHLALAKTLCERYEMDELWFMVSPQNPLKQNSTLLNDAKRLELVQLAIDGDERLHACDFEFSLPKPSYTVHTLEALREAFPQRTFILIIGADNWQIFPHWYKYDEILATTPIWIYPRPGYPVSTGELPPTVRLIDEPLHDFNSTDIRSLIARNEDLSAYLPPKVWQAIQQQQLYTDK